MFYDNIEWHYNDNFPEYLTYNNSFTHICFMLKWIIDNNFLSKSHKNENRNLGLLQEGLLTIPDYFIKECDGVLWSGDFSDNVVNFLNNYYRTGLYKQDYLEIFNLTNKTFYNLSFSDENFEKINTIITKRFMQKEY